MSDPAAFRFIGLDSQLTEKATDDESRWAGLDSFLAALPAERGGVEIIVPAGVKAEGDVTAQLGPGVADSAIAQLPHTASRFAITIYSSRSDAHDWLAGEAGAWRRSMRCLQKLVDDGVPVDAEIVLTRPGAQQLPELAELLARIRPLRVVFRVPVAAEVSRDRRVMLVPRLPLVIPFMDAAVERLEQSRITCIAENFPICAGAPDVPRRICRVHAGAPIEFVHCDGCDPSRCSGVQRDYVEAFGWDDLAPQTPRADIVLVPLRAASPVTCGQCVDAGEESSARSLRMQLTRAASTGAKTLRIIGSGAFWHRDAPSLLRDAARMSFDRVEVAGEASGLARFTDSQLARLNGITTIDFPLFGPDAASHDAHCGIEGAWALTWSAMDRLREFADVSECPFGVLHDLRDFPVQADSWRSAFGEAQPRFRLNASVDSGELLDCITQVSEPEMRAALSALLPRCCHPEAFASRERNEWLCEEQFRSTFSRSPADPIGDRIPCSQCDRNKAKLLYSGDPNRALHVRHSDAE